MTDFLETRVDPATDEYIDESEEEVEVEEEEEDEVPEVVEFMRGLQLWNCKVSSIMRYPDSKLAGLVAIGITNNNLEEPIELPERCSNVSLILALIQEGCCPESGKPDRARILKLINRSSLLPFDNYTTQLASIINQLGLLRLITFQDELRSILKHELTIVDDSFHLIRVCQKSWQNTRSPYLLASRELMYNSPPATQALLMDLIKLYTLHGVRWYCELDRCCRCPYGIPYDRRHKGQLEYVRDRGRTLRRTLSENLMRGSGGWDLSDEPEEASLRLENFYQIIIRDLNARGKMSDVVSLNKLIRSKIRKFRQLSEPAEEPEEVAAVAVEAPVEQVHVNSMISIEPSTNTTM